MAKEKLKKAREQELTAADEFSGNIDAFSQMRTTSDNIVAGRGGGNYDFYREVLRDDQVKSTFEQRRLAVTSKETIVIPASDSAEDKAIADLLKENLSAISFDSIVDKMLYSVFYGYSVSEIIWRYDGSNVLLGDIKVRDRTRFAFNQKNEIYYRKNPSESIKMPAKKFWHISSGSETSDDPFGLGLAHYLYWPTYFKRHDLKFWLIFLEKFGAPTIKGAVSQAHFNDPEMKKNALSALRKLATDSAVLVPEGVEVELLEAARSGSASYADLHDKLNEAISKIVVGQTMTTDSGSSRSQAEVHKDVRDDIVKADADLVCESFNNTVVKWWTEYNFGEGVTPPKVWRDIEPKEDQNKRAERDEKIASLGFEPTEDYITETYGEGWTKKEVHEPDVSRSHFGDTANNFSEFDKIQKHKLLNRKLQSQIVEAAKGSAVNYEELIGERVNGLIAFLEQTDDVETFREHLVDLLTDNPPASLVSDLTEKLFSAHLVGQNKNDTADALLSFAEIQGDFLSAQQEQTDRLIEVFKEQGAPTVNIEPAQVNVNVETPDNKKEFEIERDENGMLKGVKTK